MKRLGLLVLLAGCSQPAPTPGPEATESPSLREPAPPPSSRAIGTTSSLTGATSPLTGAVSAFQVSVTDTATIVALASDTLFAFDSALLAPEAAANLERTADLVRKGGAGAVQVVGHTDAKGEDTYNIDLSKRRATGVATWLQSRPGVASRRFDVVGLGEAEPVAANARPDGSDDPDGRARNRRVVVVIPR